MLQPIPKALWLELLLLLFSHSVVASSLRPHGLQHGDLPREAQAVTVHAIIGIRSAFGSCNSPLFRKWGQIRFGWTSLVAQTVKASAYNAGNPGSIPGLGRSPGEGNGNPLQYSCLENSMDRGAWQAAVHGVAKSRI